MEQKSNSKMELMNVTDAKIALHLIFKALNIKCTILDQNNMRDLIINPPFENIVFFLEDDIVVVHLSKAEQSCVCFRMTSAKAPQMIERYMKRLAPNVDMTMCVHPDIHTDQKRKVQQHDWVWVVMFIVFVQRFQGHTKSTSDQLLEINRETFVQHMTTVLEALKEYSSLKIQLTAKKELAIILKRYFDKMSAMAKQDKKMLSIMVFDKLNRSLESSDAIQHKRYLKISSNMFDTHINKTEATLDLSLYKTDLDVEFIVNLITTIKKGAMHHYDYVLTFIPKLQSSLSSNRQLIGIEFRDCLEHFHKRHTEVNQLTLHALNEIVACLLNRFNGQM